MSAIPQVHHAILTAVYQDTALLRPGYHLTQTALYRDAALLRPPYIGMLPYSDRLTLGYRLT